MSWTDKVLDLQEEMVREEIQSLRKHLDNTEQSLACIISVNGECAESADPTLSMKIQRFREYIEALQEAIQRVERIQRVRD